MKRDKFVLPLVALVGSCILFGCSKPSSEQQSPHQNTPPPAPPKVTPTNPHNTINRPPSTSVTRVSKQPVPAPKPSALEKDYRAAKDSGQRTEIIYKLGEVETPESVVVI